MNICNLNINLTYCYYDKKKREEMNYRNEELIKEYLAEFEDIAEIIYQNELLQVFDLIEFDENKINEKINTLYELLIQNNELKSFLEKNIKHKLDNNLESKFILLFNYDYFYIFYEILREYLTNNKLSDKLLNRLRMVL